VRIVWHGVAAGPPYSETATFRLGAWHGRPRSETHARLTAENRGADPQRITASTRFQGGAQPG
jgi:hypothetical protein